MSNKAISEDITMTDNFTSFKNFFSTNFGNYKRKRNYLDMLNNSNTCSLNKRIENYKISCHNKRISEYNKMNKNNNNDMKDECLIRELNSNLILNFDKIKKNLIVKKKFEYNEEKERKLVENYYRIKNAELNKLRFGNGI
jgi:hypothetical protein